MALSGCCLDVEGPRLHNSAYTFIVETAFRAGSWRCDEECEAVCSAQNVERLSERRRSTVIIVAAGWCRVLMTVINRRQEGHYPCNRPRWISPPSKHKNSRLAWCC